jgi:WD40 repeat protein
VLEAAGYSGLKTDLRGHLFGRRVEFDISPDGGFLISASRIWERLEGRGLQGSGETVLELWDLEKRTRLAILNEDRLMAIPSVDISPDGLLLAAAISGAGISIRDLFTGKEIRLIDNPRSSPALKFSPSGKLLFSGDSSPRAGDESPIFVYEVATGRQVGMWKGHHGDVVTFAISADGTMLASGGQDRVICLWDIPTGRKLASWEAHQAEVSALAITRDGGTLVSGGTDGALKLWDLSFMRKELSTLGLGW